MNVIDPSTNIISCPIKSGDTEPNSKYYLEKYFNIAWINHPHFIYIIWLKPHPEYLVLEYFLEPIPQSPKLPQPESHAEYTYFTRLLAH